MLYDQTKFKNKYRIESTRLPDWDYSNEGWYFVTICTKDKKHSFGDVKWETMQLSKIGEKTLDFWNETSCYFKNILIDEFMIMPNHLHGILIIKHKIDTNIQRTERKFGLLPKNSISSAINHFKGKTTKWCKKNNYPDFDWQDNHYEHIIRDETSLKKIRQYIFYNPQRWEFDRNNPENLLI